MIFDFAVVTYLVFALLGVDSAIKEQYRNRISDNHTSYVMIPCVNKPVDAVPRISQLLSPIPLRIRRISDRKRPSSESIV